MRINYCSLGCKVNLYETEAIINDFIEKGYELVDFNETSDVSIINTCTVTAMADAKSRKMIRQATKKNPNTIVAVMGCFSQLNAEVVKAIPGVDI
ncbi:MAG: tRNA (N(6)-L-threonylcarbamoyladenosine(37)-C(2))-methylthiotransferase MtaB, partial [Bacilli bacterium]